MKRTFSVLIIAALTLLICSCNRRELEVMDPQKAQITLKVDWTTLFGYKPNGMTVMIWGDGWQKPYTSSTNSVDQVSLDLDPGHYRMIVFNKSFDEFERTLVEDIVSARIDGRLRKEDIFSAEKA